MRNELKFTTLLFFVLIVFLSSCNQPPKTEDKEKELTIKENELLKKENELLKKEQELNKKSLVDKPDKQPVIAQETKKSENLEFLKNADGKYPFEIELLKNPILTQRLKKLIGNRYNFLIETWAVETPIEVKNNIFIASGCEAHNCGFTNFIIIIDFSKNVMYAGIRENDNVKTYSEDGSKNQKLNEFISGNF